MSDTARPSPTVDELQVRDTLAQAGLASTLNDSAGFRRLWAADGV